MRIAPRSCLEKSDKVYLVDSLPPQSKKTVEMKKRGDFVEFADFPVFHRGRKAGEEGAGPRESERVFRQPGWQSQEEGHKRGAWWGTCFSLYEAAHVKAKPELAETI